MGWNEMPTLSWQGGRVTGVICFIKYINVNGLFGTTALRTLMNDVATYGRLYGIRCHT